MQSGRYLIGRHLVDFGAGQIWLGGRRLQLHWRAFEALRELAAAGGQVVGRDHLFQALWPGTVVDESNLGKVISQLRRTLAESDPETEHIETLPGVGYRLMAAVRPFEGEESSAVLPALSTAAGPSRKLVTGAVVAAVLAVIGGVFWWFREDPKLREAEEATARGKQLLRSRNPAQVHEAVGLLRTATELNPKSARAFAALAHALNRQGGDAGAAQGVRPPALEAAERSVQLEPGCAECNGTLGLFLLSHEWEWDRSRFHLEKALRLNPNDFNIRPSYSLLLLVTGRCQEALDQIDIALRGAPFHAGYHTIRARSLYYLKRYADAAEAAERAVGIQPDDLGGWEWKSQALLQLGRVEPGIEAIAVHRFPEHAAKAVAAAREGGVEAALRVLIEAAGGDSRHSWRRARWKAMLGEASGAIDELEAACRRRHFEAMFVAVDPVFERLRGQPRFQRLVTGMGLQPPATGHTPAE